MLLGSTTSDIVRRRLGFLTAVLCAALSANCGKKATPSAAPSASTSASAAPRALSPEQAARVLARVGDRSITLGDYVAALERMDSFERLRYQSAERRNLLLREMIEVELLAQEAKRRGLDKAPETQERLRQMLRDELLKDVRRGVKNPNELAEADVRKYYDTHKADFNEPERRRVAHLALPSLARAQALLPKAAAAGPAAWGKLVQENSLESPPKSLGAIPPELAGDLGIVGPPGHPRGGNPRVPEPLRAAAFRIEKVGGVLNEIVADAGKFHILRLTAKTEARERSFEEAERTIRVAMVQELVKQREAELDRELRSKFPVTIDEAALAQIPPPKPASSGALGAPKH